MIQNNKFLIFGFALSLLFFSCDKKRVFDEYCEIDGSWHKMQKITFFFVFS